MDVKKGFGIVKQPAATLGGRPLRERGAAGAAGDSLPLLALIRIRTDSCAPFVILSAAKGAPKRDVSRLGTQRSGLRAKETSHSVAGSFGSASG